MTKFSNFIVFLFGILLLAAISFTLVQRYFPEVDTSPKTSIVIPECDLPALRIPPGDEFRDLLNKIYNDGGVEAVRVYVEKEFVPGRTLILVPSHAAEPERERVLVDREVRRCDRHGTALLEKAPVVPRSSATLTVDDSVSLYNWQHTEIMEPFNLVAWCVYPPRA